LSLHDLRRDGASIREIARQTGFARNTVRKWLEVAESTAHDPRRAVRPSKLEPYHQFIITQMSEGITNSRRILRQLRLCGYTGGITILKDFMQPWRRTYPSQATLRFETAPGEQAQVDFGTFSYRDGEVLRHLYAFAMVLSYSRLLYVEFVEHQDLRTLAACHRRAFEYLGGVPRKVLYDNMKACVTGRDAENRPIWNRAFLDMADLFGFAPTACWPYRAKTKGKVERSIKYLRQNFWPVRFVDLEDLNCQVQTWLQTVANVRLHGTTNERPVDRARLEQLASLPENVLHGHWLEEERHVSRDGFVAYRGARYGVPWRYVGRVVVLRAKEEDLEIWLGERCLARHKLAQAGATVTLPGQWAGLPQGPDRPQARQSGVLIPSPEVQVRSLLAYEAIAGGGSA